MERLYNGGDRILETMIYTKPDGRDIHANGHFLVDAPAESFFEVPTELEDGVATVHVRFAQDLLRRHGHRGVILIDKNLDVDGIADSEPVAATEEQAKRKGRERWLEHCRNVVRKFEEEVAQARAQGGAPRRPSGFTKRALELLGIKDPTEALLLEAASSKSELAELKDIVRRQQEQLAQLVAAQDGSSLLEPSGSGRGRRATT